MTDETLCLRTYAETVRNHMNKNSVLKKLDPEMKFAVTGQ